MCTKLKKHWIALTAQGQMGKGMQSTEHIYAV